MVTAAAVGAAFAAIILSAPALAASSVSAVSDRLTSTVALESHGVIANPEDVSPDGSRYVLRVIRADHLANKITVDFLTGTLGSIKEATSPKLVAHLVTSGFGSSKYQFSADIDALPFNKLHWISNSKIALLWSDADGRRQIWSIDLLSGNVERLTDVPVQVTQFVASEDGALLFNSLLIDTGGDSAERVKSGFAVGKHSDGFSMLAGEFDDRARSLRGNIANWFLRDATGTTRPVLLNGQPFDYANPYYRIMQVSPNGRSAFINLSMNQVPPPSWQAYKDDFLQKILHADKSDDAVGFYRSQHPIIPAILDMRTGISRVLWDAPVDRSPDSLVAWSPDSRSLLIAPTFLPIDAKRAKGNDSWLTGAAAAVIDIHGGGYRVLPIDLEHRFVSRLFWQENGCLTITSKDAEGRDEKASSFRLLRDAWRLQPQSLPNIRLGLQRVSIAIKQDLNSPPLVVAKDAQGNEVTVLDPTPELRSSVRLGKVASVSGPLSGGSQWQGILMYPAGYVDGHRYPLVIQSQYGRRLNPDFNLYGVLADNQSLGVGPNWFPSYPGQLLAARDIAVLTVGPIGHTTARDEAKDRTVAMVAAAQDMIDRGVADPNKIGLAGFSRNGYFVEYALTHSDFPFAAAMVADNYSTGYVQSMLRDWWSSDTEFVGAPAFGEGLQAWLQVSPEFTVQNVRAPVMMVAQSDFLGTIISQWEFFSRLRYLHKPVELFVMPDALDHGAHSTSNPGQIQVIQERVADWFDFWLTGHEDSNPSKREQYSSWRQLRDLHSGGEH